MIARFVSSHYGHLQQIKYKLIIIVTMLECKTVTLRTRPLKNGCFLTIWIIIRAIVTRKQ